jgi:hypothetical protein
MPPLIDDLWPPKPQAIMKIEQSLRENRPRSLAQMAPGYLDHKTCVTPQRN